MAKLTVDDVLKLAKLSKLQLSKDELDNFLEELNAIVDYVGLLESVDVDNLSPTAQVTGLTNVTRPDELIDYGVDQTDLLKNAPATQDGLIKVKRILE